MGADCDPRLQALFDVLAESLPIEIAAERARNAATPLMIGESLPPDEPGVETLHPRAGITWALRHSFSMREHPISDALIERAIAAWLAA